MRVEGAVALVTGANRGIGRAFVAALLERGAARVYAGARDPDSIESTDRRIVALRLDVTAADQVEAAAERCADTTLLVNNAGSNTELPLLGPGAVEALRSDLETNAIGSLRMALAFAPILAANGGGAIVNVLSILSFLSVPDAGPYGASKAAAWSLTNGLRLELDPQGTQVVGVHVGMVETAMTARFDVPKLTPAEFAAAALDGVEAGALEVLADERARSVKAAMNADPRVVYADALEPG